MYSYVYIHIHISIYASPYLYIISISIYLCIHIHPYICIYLYFYVSIYIHTHIYAYLHIHRTCMMCTNILKRWLFVEVRIKLFWRLEILNICVQCEMYLHLRRNQRFAHPHIAGCTSVQCCARRTEARKSRRAVNQVEGQGASHDGAALSGIELIVLRFWIHITVRTCVHLRMRPFMPACTWASMRVCEFRLCTFFIILPERLRSSREAKQHKTPGCKWNQRRGRQTENGGGSSWGNTWDDDFACIYSRIHTHTQNTCHENEASACQWKRRFLSMIASQKKLRPKRGRRARVKSARRKSKGRLRWERRRWLPI